jgi:TPR repeat protein
LPEPAAEHRWSRRSKCDEAAAAPYDPDRRAQGVALDRIVAEIALEACATRGRGSRGSEARSTYQHGRALWKSGNISEAKRDFEQASAEHYRAADVDLARLLALPSAGVLDTPKAVSLYEQAWQKGVPIAGFELGALYEHGVMNKSGAYVLAPDAARAWLWYQEAADAGEPNALARFGERYDDAALKTGANTGDGVTTGEGANTPNGGNDVNGSTELLTAFARYAAAAARAQHEDWPDDTWRNWRYRRASLARVLARDGMMYDAAKTYESVR